MTKRDFFQVYKAGYNISKIINANHPINRLKKKTHMIISIDGEKTLYKILKLSMIKLSLTRKKDNFLKLIRNSYKNYTCSHI